ncbi:AI-2E family transporter [Motilimonas sp. KMU-193]|uniref:AI-2E family transporter n=1 Tax=Motilimonas sp. KMU-193 TaxID=3388668 RepID=UPI00396AFBB3
MQDKQGAPTQSFSAQAVDAAIKIIMVLLMVYMCFDIVRPFLIPMTWGAIIAVALFPVVTWLSQKLKIKQSKASAIVTLLVLAALIAPTVLFSGSIFTSSQEFIQAVLADQVTLPEPNPKVAQWPIIGESLYSLWQSAVANLTAFSKQYAEQIKEIVMFFAGLVGGLGLSLLQFIISTLIAGAFMSNAQACGVAMHKISVRLAGSHGHEFTALSAATVRSVVVGVIGVALIQAVLAGIGMAVVGVPAAGIWALLVLVLAIIQLPAIIVLGPVIAYVYSVEPGATATLFMIWSLLVGVSDTFLKPMLMGRGVDIPMLVILLGAIGGMMMSGIIGLFVGSVVLALGYKLLMAWLASDELDSNDANLTE